MTADPLANIALLYAAAIAGSAAHWAKRWARGQTAAGPLAYLRGEFRHTLLSLGAAAGAVTAMIAQGQGLDGSPQALALAALAGYAADSALNKAPDEAG